MIGLQVVSISCNRITTVHPEAFSHMKKLKKLALDYNPLKSFQVELFQSLQPNLMELILAATNLYEIPDGAFKNLVNLTLVDLQKNKLSNFNARELGLTYSKVLDLEGNKLYNVSLHGVKGLVELDLSSNYLNVFNATENGLTSCMTLKLGSNVLRNFEAKNVDNLDEVDLASNVLTTLSIELFPDGTTLKKYNFRNNHIKSIEKTRLSRQSMC
jgi:Leucine-rich repeat (LRR) protein